MTSRRALAALALATGLAALACSSKNDKGGSGASDAPVAQRVTGVSGLGGDVTVLLDGLGVPHIRAGSDGDALFALGWVQAQDRFFQMDLFRKAARGRTGELLGGVADPNQDIFLRTMFTSTKATASGSHHVEDLIAEALPADLRAVMQRYADGVNRWVDDVKAGKNGAVLHPQYAVLGFPASDIAPWTIEDSIAIGRLQSFQLSDTSSDELLAGQLRASGLDLAILGDLTRHAQAVPSVILNSPPSGLRKAPGAAGDGAASAAAAAAPWLEEARGSIAGALAWRSGLRLPLAELAERAGSNNWTLAPSRTASGHVLVANDPHLTLSNPANFHMAHLTTPTRDVAGVIFPGTPVVVIGHNDRIAWGDTVVGYDVTDLYVEKLDAAPTPTSVTYRGAQVPLTVVQETRKIRGAADQTYPVYLVPHRGPLLPGSIDPASRTAMTVRWTGQDPTNEVKAFWELNAAKTVDDAFAALKSFGVGAQNFNFGDTAGHIAYDPHALVPIRGNGQVKCIPWLPMQGDVVSCDWVGFIPDEQLPQARDPSKGYIATANNDVTGALVPRAGQPDADPLSGPYLYAYTDVGFREQRIQKRLEAMTKATLDDMTALQADHHSELAETMMPGLLRLVQGRTLSANAQAIVALWQGWDFSTPTGIAAGGGSVPAAEASASAASAAFHAFLTRFAQRVLGPPLAGKPVGLSQLPSEQAVKVLVGVTQTPSPLASPAWCSGNCGDAVAASLEDTVTFLAARLGSGTPSSWRWGDLHKVRFRNQARPLLPDFPAASDPALPNDGGLFTVDVANFDLLATSPTFEQHAGPNVRIATELDPTGVRSRMVIPGGESDRPGIAGATADAHYMDQVPAWLANEKGDQPFSAAEVDAAAKSRILFTR